MVAMTYRRFTYFLRRWKLLERCYMEREDYQYIYRVLLEAFKQIKTPDQKLIYTHYYKSVSIEARPYHIHGIEEPLEHYKVILAEQPSKALRDARERMYKAFIAIYESDK